LALFLDDERTNNEGNIKDWRTFEGNIPPLLSLEDSFFVLS
jgi:ABC-type uncharacterized transport system permease subunit